MLGSHKLQHLNLAAVYLFLSQLGLMANSSPTFWAGAKYAVERGSEVLPKTGKTVGGSSKEEGGREREKGTENEVPAVGTERERKSFLIKKFFFS